MNNNEEDSNNSLDEDNANVNNIMPDNLINQLVNPNFDDIEMPQAQEKFCFSAGKNEQVEEMEINSTETSAPDMTIRSVYRVNQRNASEQRDFPQRLENFFISGMNRLDAL
jgi:hypothetical protein